MKQITKKDIIKDFTQHDFIWDITEDFANEPLSQLNFSECRIYSYAHYKTVYSILKHKLSTLPAKLDKIAYLDCLIMNYSSLQDTKGLELIISILSEGFLGISFINMVDDVLVKMLALFLGAFLIVMQASTLTNQKQKFYLIILQQLKNEIT